MFWVRLFHFFIAGSMGGVVYYLHIVGDPSFAGTTSILIGVAIINFGMGLTVND